MRALRSLVHISSHHNHDRCQADLLPHHCCFSCQAANRVVRKQVPGGAKDSLTSNTQLGRAVNDACKELETLGSMVRLSSAVWRGRRSAFAHQQGSSPTRM